MVRREHGRYENNPNKISERKNISEIKNTFEGIKIRYCKKKKKW